MDLAHLRYFKAIVECGSMTAAARVLGCSQPTLTVAVHRLEERFGTTLLVRTARGVSATSTGQELLRHTTEIFALIDRAEQRISGLEHDDVGSFVIGCHDSLGAYFLPGFMPGFIARAPRIDLALWNGPSAEVYQRVVERDVHFGLIVNPRPHPDLVMIELFRDAMELFVSERPANRDAALARLRAGPLILAGRVAQCQQILDLLGNDDLLPPRVLSCGELELVKSLTLAGLGVGVLPRRVATYGQEGRIHRLDPELPHIADKIVLAYRSDLHRTRAALKLKDALVAHGKALDAEWDLTGPDPQLEAGARALDLD